MNIPAMIRYFHSASLILGATLLAQGADPVGTAPPAAPPPPAATPAKAVPKLIYKMPPDVGGPLGEHMRGGTRGSIGAKGEKLPALEVLAPDHLALTSQSQPVLFWYQSSPAKLAFELTVTEPEKAKPLLKVDSDTAERAGIRAFSLGRQNVTLTPGITYRWSIALVPDQSNRSKDIIANGLIKRVAPPEGLERKLAGATAAEQAAFYAEAGLWYDALQAISTAIGAEPKSGVLRQRRASLLKQVGLNEAAAAP